MLADRADEILRQLLAHILITADRAAPDRLSLRRLRGGLRLRLSHFVVV